MVNGKYKIIIAPDSFKGTLTAREAANAIADGFNGTLSEKAETLCVPIADGGEGTLDAIVGEADIITENVTSPDGGSVCARYGIVGKDTAVIETATAAGLTLVPKNRRNPSSATTYGVGELILAALGHGVRKIILTVGGSATNDGGCGMLSALGAVFTDSDGKAFVPTGGTLEKIRQLDLSGIDRRLYDCEITVAADVTNPLTGKLGATNVYAAQKGADAAMIADMERGMTEYAALLEQMRGENIACIPGSGAAGGMAAPLIAFFGAEIKSGISAVLEAVGFSDLLADADAVITGEGKLDEQSAYGKAVGGVLKAAEKMCVPVFFFVGTKDSGYEKVLTKDVLGVFAVTDRVSQNTACTDAYEQLRLLAAERAEQVLKTIKRGTF